MYSDLHQHIRILTAAEIIPAHKYIRMVISPPFLDHLPDDYVAPAFRLSHCQRQLVHFKTWNCGENMIKVRTKF
jgi:hypothetical protein